MGLKLQTGEYINFKDIKKQRQNKVIERNENDNILSTEDVLYCKVWCKVFPDENKGCNPIVIPTFIEIPYKPNMTDSDVYKELKKQKLSYKDGFGRDIELDLTTSEDLI